METNQYKKRYKGICTQEVLSYQIDTPRSTMYDYCKREGISLKDGITADVAEKLFQHFVVRHATQRLLDEVEFLGTYAS